VDTVVASDDLIDVMAELKGKQQSFAIATIVRTQDATSAKAGAKAIVTADGAMVGWIGGGCTQGAVRRAAQQALEDGRARLVSVRPREALEAEGIAPGTSAAGVEYHRSVCPSGGTIEVFVEPMLPRKVLVVCGASPVAHALCDLGRHMGFAVTTAALPEDQETLPAADRRVEGFDLSGEPRLEDSYLVVATQGKRDREALRAALATPAPFIAFVGSRRKAEKLKAELIEAGLAAETAACLHSPAGLDIGAITPEEIALSILAEIVQERRKHVREARGQVEESRERDGSTVATRIM
jgi:xanthine dehydrogenase accessory factor